MKQFLQKNTLKIGLLAVTLHGLWWLILGARYAYPNTEDLSVIAFSRDNGIIWSAINVMHGLDGRYFVNTLHGVNPLAFNWYYGYQLMPILAVFFLLSSVYFLIREIFPIKKKVEHFLIASTLVVLFLSTIDLALSLYWMICSFVYIYPIFLFLFSITFFLKYLRTLAAKNYIFSLIFLILANGNSELYFPIFGLFILLSVIKLWKTKNIRPALIGYMVIFGLSAILFLSSPGVMSRFHAYDDQRSLALLQILPQAFKYSWESLINFNNILIFLLMIVFIKYYSITCKLTNLQIISLILTTIVLIVFSWVFIIYATGDVSKATRILPVITTLCFMLLFFSAALVVDYLKLSNSIVVMVFCFGYLLANNSYKYIQKDFNSGKLVQYKKEMDFQYELLTKKNQTTDSCAIIVTLNNIEPLLPQSVALIGTRNFIQANREDGKTNRAYEDYFKVDEVRLKSDTTELILKRVYEKFN